MRYSRKNSQKQKPVKFTFFSLPRHEEAIYVSEMKKKVVSENIKKSLLRRKRDLIEKTESFKKKAEKEEKLLKNYI